MNKDLSISTGLVRADKCIKRYIDIEKTYLYTISGSLFKLEKEGPDYSIYFYSEDYGWNWGGYITDIVISEKEISLIIRDNLFDKGTTNEINLKKCAKVSNVLD